MPAQCYYTRMERIADLLAKRQPQEPPEVRLIKQFILDNYSVTASVLTQQHQIVIQVPGAALAGALRPRLLELQRLCGTEKRFVIRIGR